MSSERIAYLVNQYPKVSHTFIRREILALEAMGIAVDRYSVRGWDMDLVDPQDIAERKRTIYLLQDGIPGLLIATIQAALHDPARWWKALKAAFSMGVRAVRPMPIHVAYFMEACLLSKLLRESGAKHLHAHFGTNPAEVATLTRMLGGPAYSYTIHGPEEFDEPVALKLKQKTALSAFVVGISSFSRSQIFRWVRLQDWHKIQVVHCGIEQSFYDVPPTPLPAAPRLLCVGRLCEIKGHLLLMEAAGRLKQEGIEFELILAGDGEMRPEVEQAIRQYGLERHVTITGWISSDRVREYIIDSRAMVLPSFAEGLPVVLMESMALRRPVLTTYVAGIPELVVDGENGWLVPAGDVDALTTAMKTCLATPPDRLSAMGDNARLRAIERHSITTETAKLAALIRRPPTPQVAA